MARKRLRRTSGRVFKSSLWLRDKYVERINCQAEGKIFFVLSEIPKNVINEKNKLILLYKISIQTFLYEYLSEIALTEVKA